MFRMLLKLSVLSILLVGVFMLSGTSKTEALSNNCGGAPYSNWGTKAGPHQGAMASLIVSTNVAGEPNNRLNVDYTLRSKIAGSTSDKLIHKWPLGNGRYNKKTFRTGETIKMGNAGTMNCNGWSVLGHGEGDEQGNGYVLDCGVGHTKADFWISHVENPGGQRGKWELNIDGKLKTEDLNNSGREYYFNSSNGGTVRVALFWHPEPEPPTPPVGDSSSDCRVVMAQNRGAFRRDGRGNTASDNADRPTRVTVKIKGAKIDKVAWGGNGWANETTINDSGGDYIGYAPDASGSKDQTIKRWVITPLTQNIQVKVTEQFWYPGGDNPATRNKVETDYNQGWYDIPAAYNPQNIDRTISCYVPSCEIVDAYGNGPEDTILAGDFAYIYAKVKNSSTAGKPTLRQVYLEGSGIRSGTTWLNPGDSDWIRVGSIRVPSDGNYLSVNLTMRSGVATDLTGVTCSVNLPIYKKFNIVPSYDFKLDSEENPKNVEFNAGLLLYGVTNGQKIRVDRQFCVYRLNTGPPATGSENRCGGPNNGVYVSNGPWSSLFEAPGNNENITGKTIKSTFTPTVAGEAHCAYLNVAFTKGYVGPTGDVLEESNPYENVSCNTVHNKPYFKVLGKGIRAGGGFSDANGASCNTGGLLAGWNDNTNPNKNRGAGSELSALAMIKITGVASAQVAPTNLPTKLSFANSGTYNPVSSVDSPELGGSFGDGYCFNDVSPPANPDPATVENHTPMSGQKYTKSSSTLSNGDSKSIFVDGDVYISGDIKYANFTEKAEIPSFVLRATGNIYIDKGVKQLDGLYIAKGKIYTCSENLAGNIQPVQNSNMYGSCKEQLVVNGALIANQINLMRTYGSLRDSRNSPTSCSNSNGVRVRTCASEVIDFSPEMYLSNPAIQAPNGGTGAYDSIVSLPPVL